MGPLFAGLLTLALAGGPPTAEDCIGCHDHIKLEVFRTRTHGGLKCVHCHTAIKEIPHPEKLPAVQCARCHDHQAEEYAMSVHGIARKKGKAHAATCNSCHGPAHEIVTRSNPASRVAKKNMNAVCGKCHDKAFLEKLPTRLGRRGSRMAIPPKAP